MIIWSVNPFLHFSCWLTLVTSNTRTGRLKPWRFSSPMCFHGYRLGGMKDALGSQHLPGSSGTAQSSGQVGHTSDRGVVEASFETDPPQGGETLSDPDAQVRSWSRRCHPSARTRTRSRIATRHPDRSGCVIDRQRIVEEDHQPVAGEPLQRSAVGEDEVPKASWYSCRTPITSSGSLDSANGEPAKITEDHHDLASVAAKEVLVAGVDHHVDELGERKRRRRLTRCRSSTWAWTRDSKLGVPSLQLVRLLE